MPPRLQSVNNLLLTKLTTNFSSITLQAVQCTEYTTLYFPRYTVQNIAYILRIAISLQPTNMFARYHSRFFVQVGHESTYASCGNHYFFTISCYIQTYQNY